MVKENRWSDEEYCKKEEKIAKYFTPYMYLAAWTWKHSHKKGKN